MINQDYTLLLEQRECKGGCGLKFKVLPTSPQWYARGNCEAYCRDRLTAENAPPPQPIKKTPPVIVSLVSETGISLEPNAGENKKEPSLLHSSSSEQSRKKPSKEPIILEKSAAPEKRKRDRNRKRALEKRSKPRESLIVHKIDSRLDQMVKSCLDDAKKLIPKVDLLKNKMDIAFLYSTYCRFKGGDKKENAKTFKAMGLEFEDLEVWVRVREVIYVKFEDPSELEKYTVEDLYAVASGQIPAEASGDEIRKIIEEKINGKYQALVKHFDESLANISGFYEKFSLDLISQQQFDHTYGLIKTLSNKFRLQHDRKRNRKGKDEN